MSGETDSFEGLVRRLGRWILLAGAVGVIVVVVRFGWGPAAGFAFGVAGAILNMRWLANALARPTAPNTGLLVLRFALIGGVTYVILELFGISPLYIIAGLLTASIGAVLEFFFQLFYART